MTIDTINPDSVVLDQLDEQWQKMLAMIVWKFAAGKGFTLTAADVEAYAVETERGEAVLFTHGHKHSIDFMIVTEKRARELAAHDAATNKGRA